MRLLIAAVGRVKQGPERDLFAHYLDRAKAAGRKVALSPPDVAGGAGGQGPNQQARMEAEAALLLAKRPSSYKLVCLDRGGTELGSEAFAESLARSRDGGAQGLAFFIGGADGLGRGASSEADLVLSLGPMT